MNGSQEIVGELEGKKEDESYCGREKVFIELKLNKEQSEALDLLTWIQRKKSENI